MVGCVFLSQNWAPLVKKIHKLLAAFFCPKNGHHSLKKFTNGWLRFFCPKIGHHSLKNLQLFAAFFLSQNWASLVKKRFFNFFFGQQKNHCLHLNWKTTKQKFLILSDTRNQQPIFSNESVRNSPAMNLQMVGCVFLSQKWAPLVKKFTNGWLRFFVPKMGTTR